MRRFLPFLFLVLVGCNSHPQEPSATSAPPAGSQPAASSGKTDLATPYEALRSSNLQFSQAMDAIEEAMKEAKDLGAKASKKEIKQAFSDAVDQMDSSAASIEDYDVDPPTEEEFKKTAATWDTARKKRCDDCNDALTDAREAMGMLDDLASSLPPSMQNPLEDVTGHLEEAIEALKGALATLGGVDEGDNEADDKGAKP
ncbi:MAG: hypothetical protein JSS72_02135 [Armatimonadetes bacterium]|nr:hypothetical protein [Armatimonadota bacterium]